MSTCKTILCNECHNNDNVLYECCCCRSNVCSKCCVNNDYLLCKSCSSTEDLTDEDMYTWLIKCDKCGNMWDGNAQCNCWIYDFTLEQEDDINENDNESEI